VLRTTSRKTSFILLSRSPRLQFYVAHGVKLSINREVLSVGEGVVMQWRCIRHIRDIECIRKRGREFNKWWFPLFNHSEMYHARFPFAKYSSREYM